MIKEEFSARLLEWHRESARDLPWRGETDIYRIWLSEVMLQQTRTDTVKRYYDKFIRAFPDVFSLADAPEDTVLKMWEGMGYYSRAKNLHKAAKIVAYEMNGMFPKDADGLKKLPGIGDYASCAIASIACGERVPALDGNQARVLTRVMLIDREIRTPASIYNEAVEIMPYEETGEYNQALMGLGAMVCTPRNPKCERCPVRELCLAHRNGMEEKLPVKPEKLQRRVEKRAVVLVFDDKGRVYVRKRGKGLLEGLWEFPNYENARTKEDVRQCLLEEGIEAECMEQLPKAKHVFTHIEWHMTGYAFKARNTPENLQFFGSEDMNALTIPSAFRVYREEWARLTEEMDDF